jgi:hypothetical protein
MKFTHCRLWEALVVTHKYSKYCADRGPVLYSILHLDLCECLPKLSADKILYQKACRMKFAHCRLWVVLLKAHKYIIYYEDNCQYIQYRYLWVFSSASHGLQWTNFILQAFSIKFCLLRALGGARKDP